MMILRYAPASHFARKARIALATVGLSNRVREEIADTLNPQDSLRQQNPLGKIPVLITEAGKAIYDSAIILDYFDHLAGGNILIPHEPGARFDVLVLQAMADGISEAALLLMYERRLREPEQRVQVWHDMQMGKIIRGLAALEAEPPVYNPEHPHAGAIATACALGYLDLRFEGFWRRDYPKMVAWLDHFEASVPSFAATRFNP